MRKTAQLAASLNAPALPGSNQLAPLIQLQKVTKIYKSSAGDVVALKDVNSIIHAGEYVGVVGKSGAGKSTLVNMITGVDHLTEGSVHVNGVSVHDLDENGKAAWRGRNVGVVYQYFQLMPTMTLLDNILLPMDLCGSFRGRQSVERAFALLEEVELVEHASKLPSAISGGQQQRVAIARALANDPPIVIADEPTGRLDLATAEIIFHIFHRLVQQGKTVLVVSHDTSLSQRVSHLIEISDGEIVYEVWH